MSDDHCPTPKMHPKHLCKLKKLGQAEELRARNNTPTVTCDKCGARGNQPEDVCRPQSGR
ncbi:hypothetical protein [Geopsychrobacter electrodiphilus]|uniref:hypothetical protein n=1 Tax=Geopsychrobacter electrodiphilus TaxID=225196 RepID=UPI000377D9DB|nr:hypothetical protein [Geopsychrobacter electrodiphilus]